MKTVLIPVSKDAPWEIITKSMRLFIKQTVYRLHFVHMLSSISSKEYLEAVENGEKEKVEEMKRLEGEPIHAFAENLKKEGYKVEVSTPMGVFHQKFAEMANEMKPAFIMMLTTGSDNLLEEIMGTNTSYVFENTLSPMFIVPIKSELVNFKQAAIGLELENENLEALKPFFDFVDETGIDTSFIKIEDHLQMDIINDERVLIELGKLYPNRIDHIVHRESEDVAEGLEKYADESGSDLIVLFTTRRNFIEKLFHKSVTRDLILHSKMPLLIYHY